MSITTNSRERRSLTPIIIGAGRGARLGEMTDDKPKCYTEVNGKTMLEWILLAFKEAGLGDPVFVGGYHIETIKSDYPQFTFCHNDNWQNNNILASLFYAEEYMSEGFICSYSDILYRSSMVKKALENPADIVLTADTGWRKRYQGRTEHPESDGEKLISEEDKVIQVHRDIEPAKATGEYTGVAKFSPAGAKLLRDHYHRVRKEFSGKPWREAKVFEKAYKILLFQEMLEQDVEMSLVTTDGEYIEIDTQQDYRYALKTWTGESNAST